MNKEDPSYNNNQKEHSAFSSEFMEDALREAVMNSDIQFFTYYPGQKLCRIFTVAARLSDLPTEWTDFPEDFVIYTKMSDKDADAYRNMLKAIDDGNEQAECTIQLAYEGVYTWERIIVKATRDSEGRPAKALGYSVNVTAHKSAEDRLQRERVRQMSMEGGVFEAFSFNLSKNTMPTLQTTDKGMNDVKITKEMLDEAIAIAPALTTTDADTRAVLLKAAARIPDAKERATFISTCSGAGVRKAYSEGRYNATLTYRRCVNDVVHWVSSMAEVLRDPETGDLIAFYYTKDINDEVIAAKIAEKITKSNYSAVAYCEMQTRTIRIRAAKNPLIQAYDGMDYDDAIRAEAARAIDVKEEEECYRHFAVDTVVSELAKAPVYTYFYTLKLPADEMPGSPNRRMKCDFMYVDRFKTEFICMIADVTQIYEQERETREKLASALVAAEQASVAKTEFLSRMSHEIRTPMNAIIGLDAIALQEEGISETMEDHLRKIGISARFLLSLINDILDMSRIESGRMVLKNEKFDFEEFVDGINTILYEQCKHAGIEYECVLKSFTEREYIGDATKLQQVLINVLGNAVKFTPSGGKIHFSIEQLSRTKEYARLRFEVSDTGIGIDETFINQMFEPFSQENRGRTSAYGGTGLGLAISRNIVKLMDGDINVHSIKNVGSEFTIDVRIGMSEESAYRHDISSGISQLYTLIVDDDAIVCRHTKMILDEAGFKSEFAESGISAVDMVTANHKAMRDYDLILLDWQMPDMDGIATAREIRKIVGPEVTIIIMTAYDWIDIEKKAREAGVDMFMKKPVFASSVTKAFENVFKQKKCADEPAIVTDYDFSGRRILLAEDNVLNSEIARSLLEMKHCEVEIVVNGAEAVESFAAAKPGYYDAILMDVRMPLMDGIEATRAIRAMRRADGKTIPIIAMTANAFQEDVKQTLESGMNVHLAKPIEPKLLYDTLDKYFD